MAEQMSVEEAAQRLTGAILVQFADCEDDDYLPVRELFEEIAETCNVANFDSSGLPDYETVGWLRERCRLVFSDLAAGEQIP